MSNVYIKKVGMPFAIILTGLCVFVIYGNGGLTLTGFAMLSFMSAIWAMSWYFRRHLLSIAWAFFAVAMFLWFFVIDLNEPSPFNELLISMKSMPLVGFVVLSVMTLLKFLFPFKIADD